MRASGDFKPNPQGYGPLNMKYVPTSNDSLSLIGSLAKTGSGLPDNSLNYGHWRGMGIRTSDRGLLVTALGRYYLSTNSKSHALAIIRAAPAAPGDADNADSTFRRGKVVAQTLAKYDSAQVGNGNYIWSTLDQPVYLEPLTCYFVASYEKSGDDSFIKNNGSQFNVTFSFNSSDYARKFIGITAAPPNPPDGIGAAGVNFQLDSNLWYTNSSGNWVRDSVTDDSARGIVNFKVR